MSKPAILTVDDDPMVSAAIGRDLLARYGADYRVVRATSGPEALDLLARLALRDDPVAMIVADQRMPRMTGTEMLAQARTHAPDAKFLLLTAYADTDVAITAINEIGLDYYLMKPWDPPTERLYPVVDDLLGDWRKDHPEQTSDVRVVGHRWSDRSHEIKLFLTRNHVAYRWYDVERDTEGARLEHLAGAEPTDLPLVLVPDGEALRAPSTREVAVALGLHTTAQRPLYDICIVGGGPAGLAAGVYAASEGLSTVIVEREAPGGQAGQSASIENYLGFPRGLSGSDLAHRALAQVSRFGAELVLARDVVGFETRGPVRAVLLEGGGESRRAPWWPPAGSPTAGSRRRGSTPSTAAASTTASTPPRRASARTTTSTSSGRPTPPARPRSTCRASPSGWCCWSGRRRSRPPCRSTSSRGSGRSPRSRSGSARRSRPRPGDGHLETLTLLDRDSGRTEDVATSWLFVFIGAAPRTEWLGPDVVRDDLGFVLTGPELAAAGTGRRWPLARPPFALETSVPGLFAAGDVRLDSMKRVASAVGEGAMSVYLVHRYLATT